MRLIFEVIIAVVAFFALEIAINIKDEYADLVAGQATGYCSVKMGSTTATLACNRISRIESGL